MASTSVAVALAAITVGATCVIAAAGAIVFFHGKSRWQVPEAPREWVWQICCPLVKGTSAIALFGAVFLIPYYLVSGQPFAGGLQGIRFVMNMLLTALLRRKMLSYRMYCRIGYPLHMVDLCTTVWGQAYLSDFMHRHRNTGMVAMYWRFVVPFYTCDFKLCIIELVCCTAAEVLALRASVLHFGEEAVFVKHCIGYWALTAIAVMWVYVWCIVFHTFHRTLQEVKVEKEATTSILSMLCDASFWLAADGDTLLGNGNRLETVLGRSMQGKRFSQCIPPEEHSRLRALFDSLPGSGETSPVHLLPTAVLGPGASTQAVDLFIVDRRLAFSAGMGDWVLTEEQRQATSQRQGFLVGLRLVQRPGRELEQGGVLDMSEALEELETLWAAPSILRHGAPPRRPASCGAMSVASMPVDEGAAPPIRTHAAGRRGPTSCRSASVASAPEDERTTPGPCDQLPQPDAEELHSEADQPAGSKRRPAPSSVLSSCSGSQWHVHEHNSFLTVASRRPRLRRRAESAPPRISTDAAPAASAAPAAAVEEECSASVSAESSASSGSSVVKASVLINSCDDPQGMGLKGNDSCVHLTDLLGIKARGWKSCGSWGHAQGLCKICAFHNNPRGGGCAKGMFCMRCHEQHHNGVVSRSLRRRHNKRNGQFLEGQWGIAPARVGTASERRVFAGGAVGRQCPPASARPPALSPKPGQPRQFF